MKVFIRMLSCFIPLLVVLNAAAQDPGQRQQVDDMLVTATRTA